MSANRTTFNGLLKNDMIAVRGNALFNTQPMPLSPNFSYSRAEGMMLGLAIGDSLGNTSEGMLPQKRFALYKEIKYYLPNKYADQQAVGLPSDDTQLAFWTLEQIVADQAINPEHITERFSKQHIFGIGKTMREFLRNYKQGKPLYNAGVKSAGNGAIMRIAPVVFPYLNSPSPDLWVDTALLTAITHNNSAAISTSIAFVSLLWHLLSSSSPPEPSWYKDEFIKVTRELEIEYDYTPRTPNISGYYGGVAEYCQGLLDEAWDKNWSVVDACNYWYSGAYLLETIPSVLYILMRWGHDPEQAIIRAVNDTKDNDTIAAIVGAAVRALYGKEALPKRWIANLFGRTGEKDDGQIFSLLKQAEDVFRQAQWVKGNDKQESIIDDESTARASINIQCDQTRTTKTKKDLEHFRGCLLGGAIGDALGYPVEFMNLKEIKKKIGEQGITQLPKPALISDDTQMTMFTAEGLLRAESRYNDRGICDPTRLIRLIF